MAQAQPSLQELIRQRTRAGFVGREGERAAFLGNFDLPPGDGRHCFRFHVHGSAGVGKTFLVRELKHLARERGALTVYVDESTGSVPEALSVMCAQFADQGHRLKELERRLATYRERRHEAEAAALAVLAPEPEPPSAGSRAAVELGLGVLDATVPGAGLVTRALPADRLAQGADRLRAGLSARFRNPDDVDLVLSPEKVLTPVLLGELRAAASAVPWIALFFDTYERTGPFLDPWLYDVLTKPEEHGRLPAAVVVVTAGQRPLDTARWSGLDAVTDMPLAPFTEAETRRLLAARGVVAEPVVDEVLRLTGGLPVLVSTLAANRPAGPEDVRDPSATAVSRFLHGEPDEARREVARICALPRWLNMDVFRILVVDRPDDELDVLYEWLTGLPFVGERGERVQYHDVVRTSMLRLERRRSPREWAGRHRRLAETFAQWRAEVEDGRDAEELWDDEEWRALRLEETYHLLCARPRAALGDALRSLIVACRADRAVGRRWARMLEDAGGAADDPALRDRGRQLDEALANEEGGVTLAMDLLLARPGLDPRGRAEAHALRGRELRHAKEYRRALEEYERAIELDPRLVPAHYGRGVTHQVTGDFPAALAALNRADELAPDTGWILAERAETYRLAARFEEAVVDFDRAIALHPTDYLALTGRAVCRQSLGRLDEALADVNRALSIDPEGIWALWRRAQLHGTRGELDKTFADLDRAVSLRPDMAWVAFERGDAYRLAERYEEAVTELGRAVSLEPDDPLALASRGAALHDLDRNEEALADLDRAVELAPDYAWALLMRSRTRLLLLDPDGMFEDLRRAVEAEPDNHLISAELGMAYRLMGRYDEAIPVFHRILERDPDYDIALAGLGAIHRARKAHGEALRYLDRAVTSYPAYAWAYGQRARLCLAIGRSEQALADLDRCCALDPEADWEGGAAIELLMWCGRWEEAAARLADADRAATPDDGLDRLRVRMHRHTGQWDEARRIAERLREAEPLDGTLELAITVGRSEGLRVAEPLWREVARSLEEDDEIEDVVRAEGGCLIGCALADWAEADRGLTDFLATDPGWDDLSLLADTLTELLQSPDANRTRLASCLAAVTTARDAVQARYAE